MMIRDDDSSKKTGTDLTQIDLGDDLLEKTALGIGLASSVEAAGGVSSDDQIQSARIHLNEGFSEEAKKILRQIILADPSHVEARKILHEIHESELKQMFGAAEPAVRKSYRSHYDESILDTDSEQVLRLLERDVASNALNTEGELSFFSDARLLGEFADKIDREVGESFRDRMDLAIGFLEMGLYSVTIRILQSPMVSEKDDERLGASAIVAYAMILNDEPFRAISALQPILNDGEIDKSRKTECFYLMGRAYQALSAHPEALSWYLQAQANEPEYRDSLSRIMCCKSALAGKPTGK